MLGSTGRPCSILCHLLARTPNYSFPRTGTGSALTWDAELRCSGDRRTPRAEVRADARHAWLRRAARIQQPSHPRGLMHAGVCTALCCAPAGFSCSDKTLQNLYFSGVSADFGWFLADPRSCPCGCSLFWCWKGSGLTLLGCGGLLVFSRLSSFPFEVMHCSQPGFIAS